LQPNLQGMFDEFMIEANGLIFSPGGSTAGEPLLGRSIASGKPVRMNIAIDS
jgi:hypothetical protein